VATQRRAMNAAWSGYRAGTTELWRVFEVSHSVYAEEVALARAERDLARAQARLLALTGRGDLLGIALPQVEEGER
jgi:outer membrane protein TolC